MFRVDGPDTAATMPTMQQPGANPGFFRNGVPQLAQLATVVTPDWANTIQEEIIAVIDYAGIALDKTKLTQLRDALLRMLKYQIAADVGTANAIQLSLPKGPPLEWGLRLSFARNASNTGPVTVSYNGSAPQQLYSPAAGGQLEGGELYQYWFYTVAWTGGGWMLADKPGGAMPVPDASKPHHAINLSQFPGLFDGRFPSAFSGAFPPAFDARYSARFAADFDYRWNDHFDPYFNDRFGKQFPPNFDSRWDAKYGPSFEFFWNNWVLPNFFKSNVSPAGYAHYYQHPASGGWPLFMQAGSLTNTYGAGQYVPFPIAFPNQCIGMAGSEFNAGGWIQPTGPAPTIIGFDTPARDYFRSFAAQFGPGITSPRWASPSGPITLSWIAFGF